MNPPRGSGVKEYQIASLERGLAILTAFSPETPELSLGDVARRIGITKGTAFRHLAVLSRLGFVMRVPETGRYRLHLKALDLGSAFLGSLKLPSLALPHLEALARDTMEAASMGVLDGAEVVYIARAATRRWMSTNLQVGSRLPAYCTSLGRAILAYLPLEEARRLLQGVSMTAHTEYTVTEPEVLLRMLGEVRRRGYAWNNEELEIGLRSVAAPVRRAGGVVAAINVSAASARISADRMETEFVPRLLEAAEKVSHAIGALELGVAWAHGSPGTGGMDRHATSSSDAVKLVPARTRASTRGAVQGNR